MMNKEQGDAFLDFLAELGSKPLLDCVKKLYHYDVDRNDRVAQLRIELGDAYHQAAVDAEDPEQEGREGNYNDAYNRLESAWQMLSERFKFVDRNKILKDEVLPAIFFYLELGYYPPPELLMLLHERFDVYMAGKGEVSLEEVFFGPPHRKAGNYAARSTGGPFEPPLELFGGKKKGLTKLERAEQHVERHTIPIEPESLLRADRRGRKKKHRKFYSDK